MSPNRGLGLGYKNELKANGSGSHRVTKSGPYFIPFTYGITEVELCVSVQVFDASLALLTYNRNKEGI